MANKFTPKLSNIQKAAVGAVLRFSVCAASAYVIVGCINYPQWWKGFVFGGGIFSSVYWKSGVTYLRSEFAHLTPLASLIVVSLITLGGATLFWLGKHSDYSEEKRTRFFRDLPPKRNTAVVAGLSCLVALLAASFQQGSYSAYAAFDEALNKMISRWSASDYLKAENYFSPPEAGVYLYLNENLVVRQFLALQDDLRVASTSESLNSHTNVSLSLKLPLDGASAELNSERGGEKTINREAPDVSPSFCAQQIISRLKQSTNVFQISPISGLGSETSQWLTRSLEKRGVQLTEAQIETLRDRDRADLLRQLNDIRRTRVVLYSGPASVIYTNSTYSFRITRKTELLQLNMEGFLDGDFTKDSFVLFLAKSNGKAAWDEIKMLLIVEQMTTTPPSDVSLKVIPYAIW